MIPIQLTKAVVENGSDVGPFPPLPIHLCALCDLCGIPPHPDPKTFSDDLWLPTRLDWEADPKGGAMILEAPRTARLAPQLTDMPMLAIHPQDGETPPLAFAFHGLGYWNRATGAFAWIGHAQPAKLELAGNIGYYADALQGLSATWVVEHKLTGVGAGLLLHQAPLPPTAYGFAAGDPVDLVVVSEMIDLDADLRWSLSGRSGAEEELESLSRLQATGFEERPIDFFGADSNTPHRIDRGYAYWTSKGLQLGTDLNPESPEDAADAADREVGVRTALVRTDEGRLLLYEAIGRDLVDRATARGLLAPAPADAVLQYSELASLESLLLPEGERWGQEARVRFNSELAQLTQSRADRVEARLTDQHEPVEEIMELAAGSSGLLVPSGLYIDYETVSTGTISTLQLLAGRTYYISGAVSVSNQLTIEGGAVVKLSGGGKITLLNGAQIVTPQEHWAPATFVSMNCDDIGAVISGSTGTPARGDYQRCLVLYGQTGGTIQNLRLAHSWQALELVTGAWEIGNIVFRDHYCSLAIMEDASAVLRNSLVHTGKYWAFRLYVDNDTIGATAPAGDQYQLQVEHVTVIGNNNYVVRYDWTGTGTGYTTFSAINSIFGWPNTAFCSRNNTSIAWQDEFQACAFRSSTDPGAGMREDCLTMTQSTDNYFAAQSTGNYYLAPTVNGLPNPLIDAGITNVALKAMLADKTAIVPLVLSSPWSSAGGVPTAFADGEDGDALDLGYHYPKVDAVVSTSGLSVESDLELEPGQLIAADSTITVTSNATVKVVGAAADPVVMVPCWQISDELVGYRPGQSADQLSGLWVKNTAGDGSYLQNAVINGFWRGAVLDPYRMACVRDNQISVFEIGIYVWSADESDPTYPAGVLGIDNSLFCGLSDQALAVYHLKSGSLLRCCTLVNFGRDPLLSSDTGRINVTNSLFANCQMPLFQMGYLESLDYCGFFEAVPPIGSGVNNSRTCTVSPFTNGPFGRFYLNNVADGGNLLRGDDASPTNGGTGTASENGVYHRTVDPSASTGEGSSEVSIGYHYPPYPQPDLDGNGVADVDEDTDGDGLPDAWELEYELNPLDSTLENGLAGDPDYDGSTNQEEYELGEDPHNPAQSIDQLVARLKAAALRVEVPDSEECNEVEGMPVPQIDKAPFEVGLLQPDEVGVVQWGETLNCLLSIKVRGKVEVAMPGDGYRWDIGWRSADTVSIISTHENTPYESIYFVCGDANASTNDWFTCQMVEKEREQFIRVFENGALELVYDTWSGLFHCGAYAEIIDVKPVRVDLDVDSDYDRDIDDLDDPIEVSDGGLVVLNKDDDNGNGIPDKELDETGTVTGEDDLIPIKLKMEPTQYPYPYQSHGDTLTLSVWSKPDGGKIRVWTSPDKESELVLPKDWPLGGETNTIPPILYVEGIQTSKEMRDVELRLGNTSWSGLEDRVNLTILSVELTAHRPYSEGPAYGNPFQDHEVPDDEEESPGAGIRINGDTETAANENDLIEVELEVEPFPVPSGVQYFLRRNNSSIKVWDNRQGTGTALLDSGTEAAFTVTASPMSVWVENPSGGNADFELVAKDSGGNDVCSDKIHFYPFTSVVIVFEGENGTPSDPPAGGVSELALSIYTNGYDVHLYDEPDIHEQNNGEEQALDEIANATGNRQVTQIAIMGYSHGGGSTYRVADDLNGTITMSAYIDAVSQPLINMSQETRLPPGSQYHLNYYQVGVAWPLNDPFYDLGLDGGPVPGAVNINLDQNGQVETHTTIDDDPAVLNGIRSALFQRVSK
ncbi:MAG: thrombospondin type 3 repeat-containing protein [Verrucomicrobiota bacterium]